MEIKNIQITTDENIVQKYMRISFLGKYFGIGKSTLWKLAKEGRIKPIKISRGITVFEVSEVEKELIGGAI